MVYRSRRLIMIIVFTISSHPIMCPSNITEKNQQNDNETIVSLNKHLVHKRIKQAET